MPIATRRSLLFFLLLLFSYLTLPAQNQDESPMLFKMRKCRQELELIYTLGHIGHNLSLTYTHYLGKKSRHAITGGLKYHLETEIHNPNSVFDGWTFYQRYPRWKQTSPAGTTRRWKDFLEAVLYRTGFTWGYKYRLDRQKQVP